MHTYLINANFPDEYENILRTFGNCVRLPCSASIPLPVGAHPDTLLGKIDDMLFVYASDSEIIEILKSVGAKYTTVSKKAGATYPDDCAMNFFTVRKYLVGRLEVIAPEAIEYAQKNGYEPINVKQGYAHCSTATVDDGIITADLGIFRALSSRGIPSYLCKSGDILLPPFQYGFIGGACGMADDKTVFFFGSLSSHQNGDEISCFCRERGVLIKEADGQLFDFGGFIRIDT